MLSRTVELVWLALVLNHAISGSVLSLPFPLACFCYGALESPQPNRLFFSLLLGYTLLLMGLKMAYQLPIVCGSPPLSLRRTDDGGVLAVCRDGGGASRSSDFDVTLPSRSDYTLGLHK